MSAPKTPAGTPGQAAPLGQVYWDAYSGNPLQWKHLGEETRAAAECGAQAVKVAALAARQPQPAPDSRRALLDIIDVVEHLDEPGPEADHIRLLAEYGLGEAAHPDDDGPYHVEADTAPPHPPLTMRDLEDDARDMAAEDGDHDRCEPTL